MTKLPAIGEVFDVAYPFSRTTFQEMNADHESGIDFIEVPSWKVGPTFEQLPPEGDTDYVADAVGRMVLTVISVHTPGRYPSRVFFTRTWVSPDGKAFGKTKLRVMVAGAFWRIAQGYRHEFTLRDCKCDGCAWPYRDHRKRGISEAMNA